MRSEYLWIVEVDQFRIRGELDLGNRERQSATTQQSAGQTLGAEAGELFDDTGQGPIGQGSPAPAMLSSPSG